MESLALNSSVLARESLIAELFELGLKRVDLVDNSC